MPSRRKVLAASVTAATATAGCADLLEDDSEERDELYDEVLDAYGDGETAFDNAMDDFERGEELFRDESYGDAERYFRDAERGFESAADSFSDARAMLRELEELNSVLGDAEEIIDESWDSAISFSTYAGLNRDAAVEAQDNERVGWSQFEATEETIQEEGHPQSLTTRTELMGEFIE